MFLHLFVWVQLPEQPIVHFFSLFYLFLPAKEVIQDRLVFKELQVVKIGLLQTIWHLIG